MKLTTPDDVISNELVTEEDVLVAARILSDTRHDTDKVKQIEVLDKVLDAASALNVAHAKIEEIFGEDIKIGGKIMSGIGELSQADFRTVLTDVFKDVKEFDVLVSDKESELQKVQASNDELTESIEKFTSDAEEMRNTITQLEADKKELAEAKEKIETELIDLRAESRFQDRLEKLSTAGIDTEKLDQDKIKNMTEDEFSVLATVLEAKIEKAEATEEKTEEKVDAKDELAQASEETKTVETDNETESDKEDFSFISAGLAKTFGR